MAQDADEVARNMNPAPPQSPATSPPSASADELRARIHETRAEMSRTINEIQERLSPDHLVSDTKDAIKEATVERAKQVAHGASRAADMVRDSFERRAAGGCWFMSPTGDAEARQKCSTTCNI